ncbi:MAG: MFS transporter [Rothia sp. (in: high G+C Gram-positive bacteria)]|uniref:MFS transporter n=1 Tax=Rothia sp. (in: high G+C Gram-positive bacteria) TaxID=1885016 RepID=UPI0026E0A5EF|nr:MFS transporter [Rothia sp. (in: high G+C Gram-positive bacteria)]MDO5750460.1 MFS transporter [Rothia sp. (in: high G+C Gram-positive bacteria)]
MTTTDSQKKGKIPGWLAIPEPVKRLPDAEVDQKYPNMRLQVFMGIFIGYATFYLIRNNVPLVAPILTDQLGFSNTAIGVLSTSLLLAYGFSKFLTAMISDRSNARLFLPIGLVLSSIANILLALTGYMGEGAQAGTAAAAIASTMAAIMVFNGVFQGMGWPPSGRVLVNWFSTGERGGKVAIWNTAHNVGAALSGALVAWGFAAFGKSWEVAFWFPAAASLVLAAISWFLIRDNPEAEGLPPIAEYRNDPDKVESTKEDRTESTWTTLRKHVLGNRTIVNLALANVFVYTLRYGVLVWTPKYLHDVRHASLEGGLMGFSILEISGIFGTLLCGFISDYVFKGRRSPAGILFLLATVATILLYSMDAPLWVAMIALALFGGLIYGPVMLIGLQAIDLSPSHVAGTAAGFTGLFGYALGATMASTGVGIIVDVWGWGAAFSFMIACALIAAVFLFMVNGDEKRLMAERKARMMRDNVQMDTEAE